MNELPIIRTKTTTLLLKGEPIGEAWVALDGRSVTLAIDPEFHAVFAKTCLQATEMSIALDES